MTYTKSCLLIDDDHDDQLVFSLAIQDVNKSILCIHVDDGYQALKILEGDPGFIPDLIFLDLNLPGISGFDCLTKVKQNPKLAHIPVIIYTTSDREEDIAKTKQLGALGFITKPQNIKDLILKLTSFFERQSAQ
jgi:CheY-like chemotaxis protein